MTTTKPADDHRCPTGARGSATGMEDSLRKLSLNDIKERKMNVSQVDGLVDYSSSEEEDSDDSSDGKPHIWEVPDSKTWAKLQLKKLRQHPDYEKIINYRDDGDSKWHKKVSSILNKMTLSGIGCADLYNDKQVATSQWVHDSSPDSSSSKRSAKEAGLDDDYPEWGIIDPSKDNQGPIEQTDTHGADSTTANTDASTSTLPPLCELEPDVMETRCVIPPPKRTRPDFRSKYFGDNPEITIVKDWCDQEEKLKVFYKVKGANPVTREEWEDHYQTVVEALRRYGPSYKRKMEHDFWRIEKTMTPEKRKGKVMEFWNAVSHTGKVTGRNPYLHRVLWERKDTTQRIKAEDDDYVDPGNEGYDPDGKDGAILMDLCDGDQSK